MIVTWKLLLCSQYAVTERILRQAGDSCCHENKI